MPRSTRRKRLIDDRDDLLYRSKADRRTSYDYIVVNVIWPITRGLRDLARSLSWERLLRSFQIAATIAAVLILTTEAFYAAAYNEDIARRTDDIEFPLQGLQAAASAYDLAAASRPEAHLIRGVSVRNIAIDGVDLSPVSAVLIKLIRTHDIHSMIDWPCREHRSIVPPALRLAMNISTTKESDEISFHYFCLDSDSNELVISTFAVNEAVGTQRVPKQNFILQGSYGSFRLSKRSAPGTKNGYRNSALERTASRSIESRKKDTQSKTTVRDRSGRPELIFSWGGREGGPNSTTEVRDLVLSAAASGARFALIGAYAAYGTRWERPNDTMGSIDDLTTGRLNGQKMPYFPFGDAVVSVSADFSPTKDGEMDPKFLVLYRLDVVPQVLVKPRIAEYSDDISVLEMPIKDV